MKDTNPSYLDKLPVHVIAQIASYLTDEQLNLLRASKVAETAYPVLKPTLFNNGWVPNNPKTLKALSDDLNTELRNYQGKPETVNALTGEGYTMHDVAKLACVTIAICSAFSSHSTGFSYGARIFMIVLSLLAATCVHKDQERQITRLTEDAQSLSELDYMLKNQL